MAKITRKSYRRKRVVLGAVLLGGVALVSTGFAAWVLSANASQTLPSNVKVGVISDNEMTIELNDSSMGQTISFNAPSTDTTGRIRYGSDEIGAENLTITVSGTIRNATYLNHLSIKMDTIASITNAINANYIALVNKDGWYGNELTINTTDGVEEATKTFSYTLGFKWGTAFGGVNPSIYYDDAGKTVSDAEMKSQLVAFKRTICGLEPSLSDQEALASTFNCDFKVTLTAYNN